MAIYDFLGKMSPLPRSVYVVSSEGIFAYVILLH